MTPPISLALYVSIAVLMVDAIIEMSFLSSMVSWLHVRAGGSFDVNYNGSTFALHGKPAGLETNQGHASNGAAGTAFVAIGMGGILALWLRSRPNFHRSGFSKFLYHFWLGLTIPAALLTLAALAYVFIVNHQTSGQTIDINLASGLNNQPYPNFVAYPKGTWTPPTWFTAVLQLPLANSNDISVIKLHLAIMWGWQWNLIPLFIIQLAVTILAVLEALHRRKMAKSQRAQGAYPLKQTGGYA